MMHCLTLLGWKARNSSLEVSSSEILAFLVSISASWFCIADARFRRRAAFCFSSFNRLAVVSFFDT